MTMKKFLLLSCFCFAPSALAADITTLGILSQAEFRILSEDLGSALSYKPLTPAEPLGISGFDVGLEVTSTSMSKSSSEWLKATGSTVSDLYIPKLHIAKGLPFDMDIAGFYSRIPSTNITLYGGELRYAILPGGVAVPAVAIRGALTRLSGVTQLSLDTKSLDISVSKGFTLLTPYIGVGQVWTNSTPHAGALTAEKFTQSKVFGGININFGLTNFVLEMDKTGSTTSYGAKLGFRF
ncbi:MAG: hypothetical protein Q7S51_02340 [Gallionellaceae bacterium]|nr:hypothetical protein [Gallionellaceae bacterium]